MYILIVRLKRSSVVVYIIIFVMAMFKLNYLFYVSSLVIFSILDSSYAAEFTLQGSCPELETVLEDFDYAKIKGTWYNVATYSSDNKILPNCSKFEFLTDASGTKLMRENYVDQFLGEATKKSYEAVLDNLHHSSFVVSYGAKNDDKVFLFPLELRASDYDNYAILYTCRSLKKSRQWKHFVVAWVLSRTPELNPAGRTGVQNALFDRRELRNVNFETKEFSLESCRYTGEIETDFFTDLFW